MEKTVRQAFPQYLRRWPLLQNFAFEAYAVGEDHFVMVLRDKLSGVPSGPGILQPFPHNDYPSLPVVASNVDQWLSYLTRKFDLRDEDAAFVLPIHDSGRSDVAADFDMFTAVEREIWDRQFQYALARHVAGLKVPSNTAPLTPPSVTYNVSGPNARVNIGSSDSSVNIVNEANAELFRQLLSAIREADADASSRAKVEEAAKAMESSAGTRNFGAAYTSFMSVLADHIQVFGPVVAPYLPALAKLFN
ncbi:MAG: hypothetical protein WBN03_09685 [Desulfobacterales bacterium]